MTHQQWYSSQNIWKYWLLSRTRAHADCHRQGKFIVRLPVRLFSGDRKTESTVAKSYESYHAEITHIFNGHAHLLQVCIDQRSKWWHLFEMIGRFDIHRCHSWFPHPSPRCKLSGNCGNYKRQSIIFACSFSCTHQICHFGYQFVQPEAFSGADVNHAFAIPHHLLAFSFVPMAGNSWYWFILICQFISVE